MNDSGMSRVCLLEILLGYLQAEGAFPWPGSDSLTIDEVHAAYVDAARLGRVPSPAQLCCQHPELAAQVAAVFAAAPQLSRDPQGNDTVVP
jgi:hypothetical protein